MKRHDDARGEDGSYGAARLRTWRARVACALLPRLQPARDLSSMPVLSGHTIRPVRIAHACALLAVPDAKKPKNDAGLLADDDEDDDEGMESLRFLYENDSLAKPRVPQQHATKVSFYDAHEKKPMITVKPADATAAHPLVPSIGRGACTDASALSSIGQAHMRPPRPLLDVAPHRTAQPGQDDERGGPHTAADQTSAGAFAAAADAPSSAALPAQAACGAFAADSSALPRLVHIAPAVASEALQPTCPGGTPQAPGDALRSECGAGRPILADSLAAFNASSNVVAMPPQAPASRKHGSFKPPTLSTPPQRESSPPLQLGEVAHGTPLAMRSSTQGVAADGTSELNDAFATRLHGNGGDEPKPTTGWMGSSLRLPTQTQQRIAQVKQSLAEAAPPVRPRSLCSAAEEPQHASPAPLSSPPQDADAKVAEDDEVAAAVEAELAATAQGGPAHAVPPSLAEPAKPPPNHDEPASGINSARLPAASKSARAAASIPRATQRESSLLPPLRSADPATSAPSGVLRPLPQPSAPRHMPALCPSTLLHKSVAMPPPRAPSSNAHAVPASHQGQLAPLRFGATVTQPTLQPQVAAPKVARSAPPPSDCDLQDGAAQQPQKMQKVTPAAKLATTLSAPGPRTSSALPPPRDGLVTVPIDSRLDALEATHNACGAELARCAYAFPVAEFAALVNEIDMVSLLQRLDRLAPILKVAPISGHGVFSAAAEDVALEDLGVD